MVANFTRFDQVAQAWASSYAQYASEAQTVTGGTVVPASVAAAQALMYTSLLAMFSTSKDPVTAAGGYANALTAFWFLPPALFAAAPTPAFVSLVPGASLLQSTLLSVWAVDLASRASPAHAARAMAQAFHVFTSTIITTQLVPPGPPVIGPLA